MGRAFGAWATAQRIEKYSFGVTSRQSTFGIHSRGAEGIRLRQGLSVTRGGNLTAK
jgi:hypothetical protein